MKYVIGVLAALVILSLTVYAHSSEQSPEKTEYGMTAHMMAFDDMDKMHEEITASFDPELKEEMDEIHENCVSTFRKLEKKDKPESNNEEHLETEKMGMGTGSGFRSMMQFVPMMGMGGMMG